MSFNIGYIIWMIRGFVLSVPVECEEAAIVDGCTPFGVLAHYFRCACQVLLRLAFKPSFLPGTNSYML